jgi:hypothetical protein
VNDSPERMGGSRAAQPFTTTSLRPIMDGVLKRGQKMPDESDLEWLASYLNLTYHQFSFAKAVANNSKPVADSVSAALATLTEFFETRWQTCFPKTGKGPSAGVIESERRFRSRFQALLRAFEQHDFPLDMDAGLLMPHMDNWRSIAKPVASAFKTAMQRNNPTHPFGRSNRGPVPRFVAAAIPMITGERPSVENVAKHLKDQAHRKQ